MDFWKEAGMEQTAESITEYLKHASDLETSLYRQNRIISSAKSNIKLIEPEKPREPQDRTANIPKPAGVAIVAPEIYKARQANDNLKILGYSILGVVYFIFFLLIGAPQNFGFWGLLFTAIGPILTIGGIVYFFAHKMDLKEYQNKYQAAQGEYVRELELYDRRVSEAEEAHRKDLESYSDVLKQYEIELEEAKKNHYDAEKEISVLEPAVNETKQALDQLYSCDLIFPKYRNIIAITSMYEYFASGRCSELTGPNGAYNLYEQELRQNLIISKLDVIISKLESIKNNQYVLYTELKKTNEWLGEISSVIRDINQGVQVVADNTDSIARSATVAAYYAEITASNTEALKYIALVSQAR